MREKNNGGPAFPIGSSDMRDPCGMTLRDWFAGQALAGLMSDLAQDQYKTWEDGAMVCYLAADAMLAERDR